MANPWFRMYAEFANDPKVQMLSEAMQRRYMMLMCLHCGNGLVTLHETEIAFALRITDAELADTKAVFEAKGFIDSEWNLLNWEKRQFASDTSAARVRAHREKKKQACNVTGNNDETKRNALDTDTDTEEAKEPNGSLSPGVAPADDGDGNATCPHKKIIALYHDLLPANPRIKVWDSGRSTPLRTRWNEDPKRQTLDYWDRFFRHVAKSDFLTGRKEGSDGRSFLPGLDWLVKSANFAKVIEGRYHQ